MGARDRALSFLAPMVTMRADDSIGRVSNPLDPLHRAADLPATEDGIGMTINKIAPCFIIGEQRSGSNLLRLMLSQAGLAAPHPPHILTRMIPLEPSYGDLALDSNWGQLVEDVCTLVDRNPVRWTEVWPLDRSAVKASCRERTTVAIFGAIMDLYARARGASMWACKSMQYSRYVGQLEACFEAPRYIYLYRDGRDVALSFKRAVVGEKHPCLLYTSPSPRD